jgi:hypothetical protein
MAQNIILKRSSLPGKVPDTGSLNIGEIAVNTYDGKLFIKRSGNTDSIQSVLTTDSITTGSITLTQTASVAELVVTQDANIQRDLYVIRDIITNNDIDAGGDISGSGLQVNDTLNIVHGNFNLSASTSITGSVGIDGDLTILGEVNARQFNINIISSSVIYESGSTKFGDTTDDTHEFTGSIDVSGSIVLNGVELGGSANSGSFTGSFSGSFVGDGSGLRGVVSDDLPVDGWDYDSNSSASISEFNNESRKYIIDFQWEEEVGTPIGFKTFISNVTGSSQIVPTEEGIKFIVGNQEVALVGPNGIQSVPPLGTVSGSSQLTSSYDERYVLSGSITQTTWDNIASKPAGIVSGSSQVIGILSSLNTYTASVSTASLATTGSNTFIGTQTLSGSIIPAIDNTYDLGSATYQWRDIYVSSGSLYIDGTKVLGSTGNELQITTDNGQSIKILEEGSDSIILQSADGDIQLKTSGGGNLLFDPTTGLIDVRGTLQIQDGFKVTSSGGNSIQFGNDLGITGSISTTGNVNGINLTTFSSSISTTFNTIQSNTSSLTNRLNNIETFSSSVLEHVSDINTKTGSFESKFTTLSNVTASLNLFTASNNNTLLNAATASYATTGSNTFSGTQTFSGSVYIANDLIVQGSSSIQYISASSVSIGTNIVELNTANPSVRFAGLTIIDSGSVGGSGSFLYDSVQDEFIFVHRGNGTNITSSHFILGPETYDNLGNETYLTNNRIPKGTGIEHLNDSNISDTGTLITLDSNTVVNGTLLATGTTLVSSSAQIVGILSSLNTYTGSNDTTNTIQNSRLDQLSTASGSAISRLSTLEVETANLESFTSSINTTIKTSLNAETVVSGSSQIDVMSTTNIARLATTGSNSFNGNTTITGSLTIGPSTSTFPVNVYTSSANTFGTIAEFYNGDFTAGARTFIRVRNQISAGSTMSSYFGQGQDGKTYIIANNSARGGDIVIDGNNGNVGFGLSNPQSQVQLNGTLTFTESGYDTLRRHTITHGHSDGSSPNNYVAINVSDGSGTTAERIRVNGAGQLLPAANGTQDLGSTSLRWGTIYTSDLSLNNGIGDWTIVEGEDDLFLYNNKKGKVYKFALTEVDPNIATPKKS